MAIFRQKLSFFLNIDLLGGALLKHITELSFYFPLTILIFRSEYLFFELNISPHNKTTLMFI